MQRKNVVLCLLIGIFIMAFSGMSFSKEEKIDSKEYIGAETCKGCHETQYGTYAKSSHSKKSIKGPASKEACESCHGAGAKHVEKGGGRGVSIFDFGKKVDAKAKTAKCLNCHEESRHLAAWNMSKHKSSGVSCSDCHTAHSNQPKNLKKAQSELCYDCHKDIKSQANKQSHHPIKEGKVSCVDCHNPHGEFGNKMVKADSVNELCYKCHADKRGPYMWEHPPVEENCLTCHVAHGSNHSKLLAKRTPYLCQSCHTVGQHPRSAYNADNTFIAPDGAPSNVNRIGARSCLNCHSNIHGSNGSHGARGPYLVR